jgi:hypothetical protein
LRCHPRCFRKFSGLRSLLFMISLKSGRSTTHDFFFVLRNWFFMKVAQLNWFHYQFIRVFTFFECFGTHHERFSLRESSLWWQLSIQSFLRTIPSLWIYSFLLYSKEYTNDNN